MEDELYASYCIQDAEITYQLHRHFINMKNPLYRLTWSMKLMYRHLIKLARRISHGRD